MIADGRSIEAGSSLQSDVCIVGSGPAGLSLGLALARTARVTVHLLESGGLRFDETTQELADGDVVGTPYYPLRESRIRVLGGTSLAWGGVCSPLDSIAFEQRPWVAQCGWPISSSELQPYLDDALQLCGVAPGSVRAVDELIHRFDGSLGLDGSRLALVPVYFSAPLRFGAAYRARLASLDNLTVFLHSTAVEILLSEDGNRVQGLRVRCLRGNEFLAVARYYVLAAGGIENPRLLLASNRVHARGIGNGYDLVGRYFMEHPRVLSRYRVRAGPTVLGRLLASSRTVGARFVRMSLARVVQEREGLLAAHTNLHAGYAGQLTPQWHAARRLIAATCAPWRDSPYFHDKGGGPTRIGRRDVLTVLRRPDRSIASVLGETARRPALRRFVRLYTAVEQPPDRENRVELKRERDAVGMPKARVRWRFGSAEERTYRRWTAILLEELERLEPGISTALIDPDDGWSTRVVGTWHHLGTTRMHRQPRYGVVDADCAVHGVPNLFVVGSSVFTTGGSTAPTLTIVQLSLRLAAHLAALL